MVVVLILTLLFGGWRIAGAAADALQGLPRSNEDMIFY